MPGGQQLPGHAHIYRLTHPLGEFVLDTGRQLATPVAELLFDLSGQKHKLSVTIEEQATLQEELRKLERQQRQQIFEVEDEIEAKRDAFIEALQRRLNQKSRTVGLFRARWRLG